MNRLANIPRTVESSIAATRRQMFDAVARMPAVDHETILRRSARPNRHATHSARRPVLYLLAAVTAVALAIGVSTLLQPRSQGYTLEHAIQQHVDRVFVVSGLDGYQQSAVGVIDAAR